MMKKIFLFSILLAAITSHAQNRLYGLGSYNIGSQKWVWFGAGGTDTVGVLDSLHVRFKKPVLPGSYSTATAPPASAFAGYIIYNTDSLKPQYSNGTNWLNLPGTGGGGGGGSYIFNSPLSETGGSVSIANAAADGSTKGAASFAANDFDASSGNVSIDYANGQAASGSVNGFMTTGSQTLAGAKTWSGNAVFNGTAQFNGAAQVGGTSNGTLNIANSSNSVRGAIDLSSNNPRFNSATGVLLFSVAGSTIMTGHANGWFIGGATVPATATVDILAGTTSRPPLRLNSGPLATTAVAGGVEFLTDKFYGTISTGAARKEFALNDAALTSGRVVTTTTNGRLTDLAPGTDGHVLTLASGVPTWAAGGITSINSQTGPAITLAAGSGMLVNNTTNTVTYTWGGPITASTIITGGGNQLSLGTTGNKLSSFAAVTTGNNTLQSDTRINLIGNITYQAVFHSSDADHTLAANTQILQLNTSSLTTDRTVTLPSSSTHGQTLTITIDFASSGNHFVLASAIQDVKTGSTFTQLEWGTTYDLMVDNTLNWKVIRKY